MRELDKIAEDLFDKIRSRFENVSIGDDKAKSTVDPTKARFFNFDYVDSTGYNYGNITISLIDENSLKVYFTKNIVLHMNKTCQDEWYAFLRGLRLFSKRNLLSFDTRDINRNNLQVRDLTNISKSDGTYAPNELTIRENTRPLRISTNTFNQLTMNNKYIAEFENWATQVQEGTWAMPDQDEDKDKLRKIMAVPIETGTDGTNASSLFDNIIGSDSLFDEFEELSKSEQGATSDVRPLVIEWLDKHGFVDLAEEFTQLMSTQPGAQPAAQPGAQPGAQPAAQPVAQPAVESVNTLLKLAGLQTQHTTRRV